MFWNHLNTCKPSANNSSMSNKSDIPYNSLKNVSPSIHKNDSPEEKTSQQDSFPKINPTMQKSENSNSSNSAAKVCPSTDSWRTNFGFLPEKIGLNKILFFLLGFCLPIGSCNQEAGSRDQYEPILVCLPTTPNYVKPKKREERRGPVGLITRNKEMEMSGGKIIYGCECGKKNGLAGGSSCPRSCCMNNPGCFMNPPQCWPQYKEPPKPPAIPEQKMICIPIELIYYDPSQKG